MKENNYIVVNCSDSGKQCVTDEKKRETEADNSNASYYGYWDF